jgi:hypothetical protein
MGFCSDWMVRVYHPESSINLGRLLFTIDFFEMIFLNIDSLKVFRDFESVLRADSISAKRGTRKFTIDRPVRLKISEVIDFFEL